MEIKKIEKFEDLLHCELTLVENHRDEEIHFHLKDGRVFKLYHDQDCCESVKVNEIIGDLSDLVGIITMASESSNEGEEKDYGSSTWTFYKIATAKGFVDIRWLGESNGYYSERVDFEEIVS